MKTKNIFAITALLTASLSMAATPTQYECESQLEYRTAELNAPTVSVVKVIPLKVSGSISSNGLLDGRVFVQAGNRTQFFSGAYGSVSAMRLDVSAYLNTGEGFALLYTGENATLNWASYTIPVGGRTLKAVNEVLEGENVGQNYPVTCSFR